MPKINKGGPKVRTIVVDDDQHGCENLSVFNIRVSPAEIKKGILNAFLSDVMAY